MSRLPSITMAASVVFFGVCMWAAFTSDTTTAKPQRQELYVEGRFIVRSNHGGWWVSTDGTNYQYFREIEEAFK